MQKNLLFSLRFTFEISPELFIPPPIPSKTKIHYVFQIPLLSGNKRTIKREGKKSSINYIFLLYLLGMQSARNCAYIIALINHLQLIDVAFTPTENERKLNIILGN